MEAPKTQSFGPRSGRACENFSPVCPANLRASIGSRRRGVGIGSSEEESKRASRRSCRGVDEANFSSDVSRSSEEMSWNLSKELDSQCEAVDIGLCEPLEMERSQVCEMWR